MTVTPAHLLQQAQAIETEIREAFKDVSREGGVSWSEAEVTDEYGTEEERAAARARDADRCWTELAADATWDAGPGMGGWSFLDEIGFRYYLPAAMIRMLTAGDEAFSVFSLDSVLHVNDQCTYPLWKMNLLNEPQRQCIARFVRFMIVREAALGNSFESAEWQQVYDDYWKDVDQGEQ